MAPGFRSLYTVLDDPAGLRAFDAEYWTARGQRVLGHRLSSLAWGPWELTGMAADAALLDERVRSVGLRSLKPEEAFLALDEAHGHGTAQALVIQPGNVSAVPPDGLLAVLAPAVQEAEQPGRDCNALDPADIRTALSAVVRQAAAEREHAVAVEPGSEPGSGHSWSARLNEIGDGVGTRDDWADQRSIWEVDAS